jgi:hypothetical protein
MNVSINHTTKTESDFSSIIEAIRSGKHTSLFNVGDILEIGGVGHVIIGIDVEEGFDHSMTIQRYDHVYDHVFSERGFNRYETSDIRAYLNGEYMEEFPAEFVEAVQPVTIDGMKDKDRFFLLRSDDVDLDNSKYPYYHDRKNRTKYDENGYATWWWFRDPNTGGSYSVRYCYADGIVVNYIAHYGDRGLSPACILA